MLQAAIIFLREGFEAFLTVAIILSYLKKTGRRKLIPAVYWAVGASIVASGALGYMLAQVSNQSLWEAASGLLAIVLVTTLVIHMWRTAPQMKSNIEQRLASVSTRPSRAAFLGVFAFAALMVTREGMETALLLMQVHEPGFVAGTFLGVFAAFLLSWAWVRFGYRINLRRFFQVTSIFLLLFLAQIAIYTFHEFTETGLIRNIEWLHDATEPFSPVGIYGKWFSLFMIAGCATWMIWVSFIDRKNQSGLAGAEVKSSTFNRAG
jgi:high-affinity iron transporter